MSQPKVSIIIPVYNAGPYIEKCIRSVLEQSLKEIEVIIVNDGSTDYSLSIINKLASLDERLQVFDLENKGVSKARNVGLAKANGAFIGFVDADDWIEPEMFEQMYTACTANKCGLAICNANVIKNDSIVSARFNLTDELLECAGQKDLILSNLMRFHYDYANWNKLYAATVIRENKLQFKEEMSVWEDLLFNLMYLHFTDNIILLNSSLYNYRVHSASLFSTSKDLISQFNMLYNNYQRFTVTLGDESVNEAFKKEMARLTYNQALFAIGKDVKQDNPSFLQFYRRFKKSVSRLDPAIFYFPANDLWSLQGMKKWLLMKKCYSIFSLLVTASRYLKIRA